MRKIFSFGAPHPHFAPIGWNVAWGRPLVDYLKPNFTPICTTCRPCGAKTSKSPPWVTEIPTLLKCDGWVIAFFVIFPLSLPCKYFENQCQHLANWQEQECSVSFYMTHDVFCILRLTDMNALLVNLEHYVLYWSWKLAHSCQLSIHIEFGLLSFFISISYSDV